MVFSSTNDPSFLTKKMIQVYCKLSELFFNLNSKSPIKNISYFGKIKVAENQSNTYCNVQPLNVNTFKLVIPPMALHSKL